VILHPFLCVAIMSLSSCELHTNCLTLFNPMNTEINLHDIQFVPRRGRFVLQLARPFGSNCCTLADNYLILIGEIFRWCGLVK